MKLRSVIFAVVGLALVGGVGFGAYTRGRAYSGSLQPVYFACPGEGRQPVILLSLNVLVARRAGI